MRGKRFGRGREAALAEVRGDVLEIGFGTGLNLPHYPEGVRSLTALEPADMLRARVQGRIASARMPVERLAQRAERIACGDARFDCVVSTWTLCTVAEPAAALREVARVLRPGGRFVFLEHGRSDDPRVARWQDRLNPVQNRFGCGCNLNRRIDRLIREAGLEVALLTRFRFPRVPRIAGEMYQGFAVKGAAAPSSRAEGRTEPGGRISGE